MIVGRFGCPVRSYEAVSTQSTSRDLLWNCWSHRFLKMHNRISLYVWLAGWLVLLSAGTPVSSPCGLLCWRSRHDLRDVWKKTLDTRETHLPTINVSTHLPFAIFRKLTISLIYFWNTTALNWWSKKDSCVSVTCLEPIFHDLLGILLTYDRNFTASPKRRCFANVSAKRMIKWMN